MTEEKPTFKEAKALYQEISEQIKVNNKLYYEEDSPAISDAEYDQLTQTCAKLLELYPELAENSIINKIGGKASQKFKKVKHKLPMLSLANIFEKEEIPTFIERIQKYLRIDYIPEIVAELKIDGLSFSATFICGKLSVASTRGDGEYGEDITQNILTIKNFPTQIDTDIEEIEVRGEIYIDKADFIALNENQTNLGKQIFANPRNAAAGSLRQLDSKITSERPLKYFVYSIGYSSGNFANKQSDLLRLLKKLNFETSPNIEICSSESEISTYYDKIISIREELPFEIDGVVYKINDFALCDRLGFVGKAPRFATAHKFPAMLGKTKLNKIIIQVGRTGTLTPVAVLEPISIGGVIVSRASLYNFDEIERKDIRENDTVILQRAGDVIPKIMEVCLDERKHDAQKFNIPTHCPSCLMPVIRTDGDAIIRCENSLFCKAQIAERLSYFVSKPCLNIDSLGAKQIEFLLNKKYIESPQDILNLPNTPKLDELAKEEGWGVTSVENLKNNINKAKIISLDRLILSLGIRNIGEITAKLLAKIYKTPDMFLLSMEKLGLGENSIKMQLDEIDGIGKTIVESLCSFFKYENNVNLFKDLMNLLDIQDYTVNNHGILTDKIIVFTGTLNLQSRAEAKNLAEKLGAKVTNSVTSKTNFLVVGDNPGSKLKEAEKHGVKILQEDEWVIMAK